MEKFLPIQYYLDVNTEAGELKDKELDDFFRAFSDRDFGTFEYSCSNRFYSNYSRQLSQSSPKARRVEDTMQPIEVNLLLELWRRTMCSYKPDAEFTKVLKTNSVMKVYPDVFRKIPVNDFYINLSENDSMKSDGIIVSVRVYDNDIRILYMVCDSANRTKIVDIIDFTTEVDPMGKLANEITLSKNQKAILDMDRMIIERKGGSLKDRRICTGENFVPNSDKGPYFIYKKEMSPEFYQGHNYCDMKSNKPLDSIADITAFIIEFIHYIGSKEPDIVESELTKVTYKPSAKGKLKFAGVQEWDVAKYSGEKIKVLRQGYKKVSEYQGGTHASPRPHYRRKHEHRYWCGSGENRHLEKRVIGRIYVNGTKDDIVVRESDVSLV
ncbi:MAG: hypothetical protein IJ215_02615 [Clostridia bacterium]|nr:hypothetical protein [Clostridia bacterium]